MNPRVKNFLRLQGILLLYSLGGLFSKKAAQYPLSSKEFMFFYITIIGILFIYAILWQQMLKRIPLTVAFSNKAVVIIWGILWGRLFFNEKVSIKMLLGATIIICGIYLVEKNE